MFGVGQFFVASSPPPPRLVTWQFGTFTLGNVGVLTGTLTGFHPALDAGSVILLGAFGLFAWATRSTAGRRLFVTAYRVALVVLAVSVPAGAALAH